MSAIVLGYFCFRLVKEAASTIRLVVAALAKNETFCVLRDWVFMKVSELKRYVTRSELFRAASDECGSIALTMVASLDLTARRRRRSQLL
jgi:hypothetical protein